MESPSSHHDEERTSEELQGQTEPGSAAQLEPDHLDYDGLGEIYYSE